MFQVDDNEKNRRKIQDMDLLKEFGMFLWGTEMDVKWMLRFSLICKG